MSSFIHHQAGYGLDISSAVRLTPMSSVTHHQAGYGLDISSAVRLTPMSSVTHHQAGYGLDISSAVRLTPMSSVTHHQAGNGLDISSAVRLTPMSSVTHHQAGNGLDISSAVRLTPMSSVTHHQAGYGLDISSAVRLTLMSSFTHHQGGYGLDISSAVRLTLMSSVTHHQAGYGLDISSAVRLTPMCSVTHHQADQLSSEINPHEFSHSPSGWVWIRHQLSDERKTFFRDSIGPVVLWEFTQLCMSCSSIRRPGSGEEKDNSLQYFLVRKAEQQAISADTIRMSTVMGLSSLLYRLLTLAAVLVLASTRHINCRKYVFHPMCRGVAAKRALQETANFDDALTSADMDDYTLKEVLSATKGAESAQQERLIRALLEGVSVSSPVVYRHK
ncbi:hypothetical protein RRG08_018915, partial [Elysia crispata]